MASVPRGLPGRAPSVIFWWAALELVWRWLLVMGVGALLAHYDRPGWTYNLAALAVAAWILSDRRAVLWLALAFTSSVIFTLAYLVGWFGA